MRGRYLALALALGLSCWALAPACGSERSTSPPSPSVAPAKPASAPAPAASAPVPTLPPAPDPPGEAAYAHFEAAGRATRAVLAADLAGALPHLAWLSHHEYPQRLPPAWRPHATRLQLAARVLARAESAGEAARGLPALSAACGACHEALTDRDFDAAESPSSHGGAALALLEALSGRAEGMFTTAAGLTPRFAGQPEAGALDALRKAAARAEAAQTWVERTAAAQQLFGLCGTCHEALR